MAQLIAGLVLFFVPHFVSIVALDWRNAMAARSPGAWRATYSLISIVGFVLMIRGYRAMGAEPTLLYVPPHELQYVSALLMLPVFPLLIAAYLPSRLKAWAKHPMLRATILWAIAHLLVNGALRDVLLFGSFLVWAVADRISVAHRPQRPIPSLPASKANDAIAILVGLAIYAAFVMGLHAWLFGAAAIKGVT